MANVQTAFMRAGGLLVGVVEQIAGYLMKAASFIGMASGDAADKLIQQGSTDMADALSLEAPDIDKANTPDSLILSKDTKDKLVKSITQPPTGSENVKQATQGGTVIDNLKQANETLHKTNTDLTTETTALVNNVDVAKMELIHLQMK